MKNNTSNTQVEMLTKENVRLYEENMKLKLMLGNTNTNKVKNTSKAKQTKTEENKTNVTKTVKAPKSNEVKKTEPKNKRTTNSKTTNIKKSSTDKTVTENKELSKFQREREEKKAIVASKRIEKVSVPEIAKLINQSEPTVRNYIRELRAEGRLEK